MIPWKDFQKKYEKFTKIIIKVLKIFKPEGLWEHLKTKVFNKVFKNP